MKKRDGRKLTKDVQAEIRFSCCERVANGESVDVVMKSCGYSRTSYYRWEKEYKKQGKAGIARKYGSGSEPKFPKENHNKLIRMIDKKDPRDYGYSGSLWTRLIIKDLILKTFGIQLSINSVGNLLFKLNITPQKPLRRAYERDEKLIREWKKTVWPQVVKAAKKDGAEIFFLDEAGVKSDLKLGRTWGIKGKTPEVKISGQRQKINAISAVNSMGKFWFAIYDCKFNAEVFIALLKNFMKRRRKPLIIVLDGHPSHGAVSVQKFVASTKGKLQLVFLPPHAPDLNPDEFVWGHLKSQRLRKTPLKQNESLKDKVSYELIDMSKNKKLLKSFFRASSVAYSLG